MEKKSNTHCHCLYTIFWSLVTKYLSQAWQLHEDNREVDLVDVKLSEFNEEEVKRVIQVSFLCTQSSPTLRPSMSRVVAMLLGDIEVSTVTSKPGYLTDWKSDDPRSLRNDVAARGTVSIYYDNSESSSMVGYIDNSPVSASKPMLGKAIKQGRWELVYTSSFSILDYIYIIRDIIFCNIFFLKYVWHHNSLYVIEMEFVSNYDWNTQIYGITEEAIQIFHMEIYLFFGLQIYFVEIWSRQSIWLVEMGFY